MQAPKRILMMRPKNFSFDEDTAVSNSFQKKSNLTQNELQTKAVAEFDEAVRKLREAEVCVDVFEDRIEPICPDAVFPNNWFSTHESGLVFIYPMETENRQNEVREDVVEHLKQIGKVKEVFDLTPYREKSQCLEGTGSIVFDYSDKKAYACYSPRTSEKILREVGRKLDFQPIMFNAHSRNGVAIYHTNVMMWIGTKIAGICLDSITSEEEKKRVLESLVGSGKEILELSQEEVESFAGNCIELTNAKNESVFVMSLTAHSNLSTCKKEKIESCFHHLVICDIENIELCGGGSIRCMIAGIFLEPKAAEE